MNSFKLDNVLKYILFGAIFSVPFIPFIVNGAFFFPFVVGKALAFRLLVEIMLGVWAVLALIKPEYRPKFSWVSVLVATFVFIIGLADITGVYPMKSLWSNFERMEGWVTMVHLLGFFLVTSSFFKVEKLWTRFFNVSIFASVLMSFYGILQLAGKLQIHQGSTRLDATMGNSAYFAVYLLFHIFLTLFLLMRKKGDGILKWVYGLVIILQTIILYNTATRGALLGLVGGLMVTTLFIAIFERERKIFRKVCAGGLAGLILFVALFIGFKNTSFIQDSPVLKRFADISLQEQTTKSRFMVWGMAIEGFKERPILGWGQENFNYVFNKNYNPKMYDQEQWFDRTHNVFFDWLIAGGILGLLGYLSLFGVIIFYLLRNKNNNFSVSDKAILIGMLAGYFIHNLFVFDNLISYILFFSILAYIHSMSVSREEKDVKVNEKINRITIPIVAVATLFLIYFVNYGAVLANTNLLNSFKQYPEGIDKNIEKFEKALSYNSFGNQEIVEQATQLASKVILSKADNSTKEKISNFAFTEMQKQIEKDPNNARLVVLAASFLAQAGSYEQSLIYIGRALELSPQKQQILLLGGTIEANNKNYKGALEYFKQAYELAPEFNDVRILYATAAIYAGDNKLLEELLTPVFGSVFVYDERIIQAYYKTGQYQKVITTMLSYIEVNPQNLQARLSLAAVYAEAGYKTKAVQKIREVIKLNPKFKDQGEKAIQEILGK